MKAREVNKMNMTVHQFKMTIQEMKDCIYPFDDHKAMVNTTAELPSGVKNRVEIYTVDETTGIELVMTKTIKQGEYAEEKTSDPKNDYHKGAKHD